MVIFVLLRRIGKSNGLFFRPDMLRINRQGVGNLNYAPCYLCALLPETSCEEFNCFLDRRMLVDKKFGFMKQYVKEQIAQ